MMQTVSLCDYDGAGKHYKIVYGIILGSGAGGGLIIDKKIVTGPNGVGRMGT